MIEGLYPGYGTTIANSLRRILLSSLPGMGIVGIKIKDVDHEFSTIPYVFEDVIRIILNLKRIRFKAHEGNSHQATVKIQGEKELKAGDFKVPSELEIINPELHIATLTEKRADLEISLFIKEGLGYKLAEEHVADSFIKEVGMLKVDTSFTPVVASSFGIENMRVGGQTDYNRINLMIETDGSITPKEAFEKSILIFVDQLQALQKLEDSPSLKELSRIKHADRIDPTRIDSMKIKENMGSKDRTIKEEEEKKNGISGRSLIGHLKLSGRIEKVLIKKKVKTISQLSKKNEDELMKIDGIGEAAVKEIRRKLGKAGFLLTAIKKQLS